MSYCVNCGVELDKTCKVCPLCNTKVINPKQPPDTAAPKPFPSLEGHAEQVPRRDITILMTVILATTAVVCGLLNLFFFQFGSWSLYVIGICVVLCVFFGEIKSLCEPFSGRSEHCHVFRHHCLSASGQRMVRAACRSHNRYYHSALPHLCFLPQVQAPLHIVPGCSGSGGDRGSDNLY